MRWLRPDYQIPRFGSEADQAALKATRDDGRAKAKQSTLDLDDDLAEMKPKFPTGDELAETAAIMRVLATTPATISIEGLSRHFSQGKQVEKRVALTILALARLGHIASTDNGNTFMLRRAA